MKYSLKSLFLVVLGFATTSVIGQDADDIIDAYLKARGGKDKLMEIKTLKMTGESTSQMGSAAIEMYQMTPNKNLMLINTAGGKMTFAYDGETAWGKNPWAGGGKPTKIEGPQARGVRKDPIEDEFINYKDKESTVKYLGEEDVDDELHHKVRLTNKEGQEMIFYFNDDTKLPSQMKMLLTEGQAKGSILVVKMSDYKEVDGIMFNFTTEQSMDGNVLSSSKMTKIEVNPEITSDLFSFPEVE